MGFKEEMVASTKNDSSAYIQFITGRGREGYSAYAFVEDDDDMVVYQHALADVDNLGYLSCGGKSNVIKVYRKLRQDGLAQGSLFFVDRDTEQEPLEGAQDIFRTCHYSWENYVCQPRAVAHLGQRHSRPNLTPKQKALFEERWIKSLDNFRNCLAWHTALTHVSSEERVSLDVGSLAMARGVGHEKGELTPAELVANDLEGKNEAAVVAGVKVEKIAELRSYYLSTDQLVTARGKTLFQIFRAYVQIMERVLNVKFLRTFQSALSLITVLPNGHPMFDPIREYAAKRLA